MDTKEFGKYRLLGRLGGGGMAEVFRAQLCGPEGFKKDVALKLILPQFSDEPEFVKMFVQEATLAARLDHVNIVRIYEFDQVEGRYYIAMELVDGQDLRQLMARTKDLNRRFSVPETLMLGFDVCRGLAFAHGELAAGSQEIVHRDISPHNIILSRVGEVKITDFGIAKLTAAASVTQTGIIKGKVSYMSPEQARGLPVDRRSDIFSLGCVLWELLTGQRLFSGESDLAILDRLQHQEIKKPSIYNPEVPTDLDLVLVSALHRNPAERFSTASIMARALEKILLGYPEVNRSRVLVDCFSDLSPALVSKEGTAVLHLKDLPQQYADAVIPAGPDETTRQNSFEAVEQVTSATVETVPVEMKFPVSSRLWSFVRRRAPLVGSLGMACLMVIWVLLATGQDVSFRGKPIDSFSSRESKEGGAPGDTDLPKVLGAITIEQTPADPPPVRPQAVKAFTVVSVTPPASPNEPTINRQIAESRKPSLPNGVASAQKGSGLRSKAGDAAMGRLNLNAIPWADVYWREKYLGETPLSQLSLPAGEQVFVLKNVRLHKVKEVRVKIIPNQTTVQVFDLREPK